MDLTTVPLMATQAHAFLFLFHLLFVRLPFALCLLPFSRIFASSGSCYVDKICAREGLVGAFSVLHYFYCLEIFVAMILISCSMLTFVLLLSMTILPGQLSIVYLNHYHDHSRVQQQTSNAICSCELSQACSCIEVQGI